MLCDAQRLVVGGTLTHQSRNEKWKNTLYNILVENPNGNEIGVKKIFIDGIEQMSNEIRLQENVGVINVEVFLS